MTALQPHEPALVPCCPECWHGPSRPCPQLVGCLAAGPLCHDSEACRGRTAERNARLRRDTLARPVIFVGTGTCGLGAGAGRTLLAIRRYLETHPEIQADVVEVGCIGLCVEEPLVDVQLPGRPRVSFPRVTEKQRDDAAGRHARRGSVPRRAARAGPRRAAGGLGGRAVPRRASLLRAPDALGAGQLRRGGPGQPGRVPRARRLRGPLARSCAR